MLTALLDAAANRPTTGHGAADLLTQLALILCVAAVTTVLFQRIRQPVVLGYLLAGLIVGPHLSFPLFADEETAHRLSELGVILLMFSLGLEFSLRKVIAVAPTAGVIALVECGLMMWIGYSVGRAFGWTGTESLFTGAIVAISSTTIVVKAFAEQRVTGRRTQVVFGILVVEDLIAVLLLTILTAVGSGAGLSPTAVVLTVARLAGFLIGVMVVGIWIVPRFVRFIVRLGRHETTVVAAVGICFGFALLARAFGYSVALGAFLGGALVSESGESKTITPLIEPVRDVFAAIFFVSVGMLIDPTLIAKHWVIVAVLTGVVIVGKSIGVSLGAFVAGNGVRLSIQSGLSLAQIGEFSFIIAGLGLSLGATGRFLYPVAVAVSALTTLTAPWLIRASDSVATHVDRRMPHALQTYASLYGSWVQQLRARPDRRTAWSRIRRLIGLMLIDETAVAAIVIGASLSLDRLAGAVGPLIAVSPRMLRWLLIAGVVAVLGPFLFGAVRIARALGLALAQEALPSTEAGVDLAAAPRRALLVSLQIGILLVAGIPLVAITQPFLPSFPGAAVLGAVALLLAVPFWRSATNLDGHVRAGAQVILEALATQARSELSAGHVVGHATLPGAIRPTGPGLPAVVPTAGAADEALRSMPGIGNTATVHLAGTSPAVGKTLKQLNVRGLTGATVIAIDRPPADVVYPSADETLRAEDTLVLTGTVEAVAAARRLLAPYGKT